MGGRIIAATSGSFGTFSTVEALHFGVKGSASSVSGAVTVDLSKGGVQYVTLTGNVTSLAFSNWNLSQGEVEIHLIQDGVGARTVTGWSANIRFGSNNTPPTLTATAGHRDILRFRGDGNGIHRQASPAVLDVAS